MQRTYSFDVHKPALVRTLFSPDVWADIYRIVFRTSVETGNINECSRKLNVHVYIHDVIMNCTCIMKRTITHIRGEQ